MNIDLRKILGIRKNIQNENIVPGYKETRMVKVAYPIIKATLSPLVRGVWIEGVEGLENIPKQGPVIVASNHQSYFDFLCFTAVCPRRIHYLAAEKFYKSRIWRPVMNLTGQIKVDRTAHDKSQVYQTVYSALNQGMMIGIFPEGTRSPDGEIRKAFTGVAKFALKSKVPVLPVGIIGTYDIMSRHDKRPRFDKKAKIRIGEPIYFHEYDNIQPAEEDYIKITNQIMSRIAELAEKKYNFA